MGGCQCTRNEISNDKNEIISPRARKSKSRNTDSIYQSGEQSKIELSLSLTLTVIAKEGKKNN